MCKMICMGGLNRIQTCTHHVLQRLKDGHKLMHHVRQSVQVPFPQVPTQVHCIKLETSGYQSVRLNISHSAASWGGSTMNYEVTSYIQGIHV